MSRPATATITSRPPAATTPSSPEPATTRSRPAPATTSSTTGGGDDTIIGGSGNGDDVYDGGTRQPIRSCTRQPPNSITVDLNLADRHLQSASGEGRSATLLIAARLCGQHAGRQGGRCRHRHRCPDRRPERRRRRRQRHHHRQRRRQHHHGRPRRRHPQRRGGDDTFKYTIGDGLDIVNGGTNTAIGDTLAVSGPLATTPSTSSSTARMSSPRSRA